MIARSFSWVLALAVLSACSASLDTSLDNKRCKLTHRCLAGYTCSETGFCERASDAGTLPDAAQRSDDDAGTAAPDANASDAAIEDAGPPVTIGSGKPDAAITYPRATESTQAEPAQAAPTQADPPAQDPSAQNPQSMNPSSAGPAVQPPPSQVPPKAPPPDAPPPPPQAPDAMNACRPGRTLCGSTCVDLEHESSNCGACNHACASVDGGVARCERGLCEVTCVSPLTACDGLCLNTQDDPARCGECNKACKPDEMCSAGKCAKPKPAAGPG
jgi:hypothetical protein